MTQRLWSVSAAKPNLPARSIIPTFAQYMRSIRTRGAVVSTRSGKHRYVWFVAGVMLLTVIAAGGFLAYLSISHGNSSIPFQDVSIAKITDNAKVARVAMSRDGRYVGWVLREGATRSLWVRQVATGSVSTQSRNVHENGVSRGKNRRVPDACESQSTALRRPARLCEDQPFAAA